MVNYDSPAASLAGIKTAKERQSKKMDFIADTSMVGAARNGGDLAGNGLRWQVKVQLCSL